MALHITIDFSSNGYSLVINTQELELNTQVGAELQQSDSKIFFGWKTSHLSNVLSKISASWAYHGRGLGAIACLLKHSHFSAIWKAFRTFLELFETTKFASPLISAPVFNRSSSKLV